MPDSRERDGTLRESIDTAFKGLSREQELGIFLNMHLEAFQRDRSSGLQAFEAVRAIAAWEWGSEDGFEWTPIAKVEVPWWVVQALESGFNKYEDARAKGLITSLGEAYGLEGRGQGKKPRLTKSAKELRDIRLVLGIAIRTQQGMRVRDAIEAMIAENHTSLSFKRVEKLWSEYREKVRAIKFD